MTDDALAELLILTVGVDSWGATIYRNQQGLLHRIHGPAVIYSDGTKEWYQQGRLHREDGPAVELINGTIEWYMNGQPLTERAWNERIQSL